ncbi:MAG: ATP-binding cassette domain-containing protein [Methanoregula sp.]|jgi:ABC-type sulfate/molybdate transport systems ATPase subunit
MLEVQVTKKLRDFALDVEVRVESGTTLVLMGSNGSGKSTTLNIISGLICPDKGTIRLNGSGLYDSGHRIDIPVEDRGIGYVFQNCAVFPHLTVWENVAYGLKALHVKPSEIPERVDNWLSRTGITDLSRVIAGDLSGGQQQRVALARAFAIRPSLLMLDEPFTALDVESIESIKELLRSTIADMRIPCILVTHRPGDARDISSHAMLLSEGKCCWKGNPDNLPDDLKMRTCTCTRQ